MFDKFSNQSCKKKMNGEIDEELLEDLYGWVDQIPLTRPKKDIRRDFADGVLVAEVVKHYCPRIVEIHNYVPASSLDKKISNWKLLNRYKDLIDLGSKYCELFANYNSSRKPFRKLGFEVDDEVIKNIVSCKPWAVEQFLMMLRRKIDRQLYEQRRTTNQEQSNQKTEKNAYDPESDQVIYPAATPATEYAPGPSVSIKKKSFHQYTKSPRRVPQQQNDRIYPPKQPPNRGDMVPKIQLEEKEQELLVKDETIQILQAKVRRLEHLLHLKDIRVDDLQTRLDKLEASLRPTGHPKR